MKSSLPSAAVAFDGAYPVLENLDQLLYYRVFAYNEEPDVIIIFSTSSSI